MKHTTLLNTKMKNLLIGSLLFTAPALSLAGVTFTEIPVDNWGGTIAVSNNGVVAFAGDTQFYKWSAATGLVQLGETEWTRVAKTQISNDGNTVLFTNVTGSDTSQGSNRIQATYVYQGTAERIIYRSEMNVDSLAASAPILGGGVNTKGYHQASTLNLNTNAKTIIEDGETVEFLHVSHLSANGDVKLLTTPGSIWPGPTYIMTGNGEPQPVEGISLVSGLTGDGQTVTGEAWYCTDGSTMCTVSWNKNTNEVTEIGYFRPTDTSYDGSMMVGNGWSDAPGGKVWDSYNGTRNIIDVLTANGIDMTGWSGFSNMNLSEDGNKIAGYATNPQGQLRPFLISIVPQCFGF